MPPFFWLARRDAAIAGLPCDRIITQQATHLLSGPLSRDQRASQVSRNMQGRACLLALAALLPLAAGAVIRGLDPALAARYQPGPDGKFTCLDGKKSVPFDRVNDDYCDCLDGSDEVGKDSPRWIDVAGGGGWAGWAGRHGVAQAKPTSGKHCWIGCGERREQHG